MSKKIIVAGHICLDITPVFPVRKEEKIEELLKPGKLLQMEKADVHLGGAVANTGLGLKILGADVKLMGKIGEDDFGKIVLDQLKEYHAEEGTLIAQNESTSYSIVLAVPGIDRIFLHHSGANDTYTLNDIPKEALKEAVLFHFGYPPVMKRIYENDGEELVNLLKYMKEQGIATSLDMASVDPASEAGKADWKYILQRTLPYVDFFVPSVEELCYMLDRDRFAKWQEKAAGRDVTKILDIEKDVRPLAEQCFEYGAKVLLIKCGTSGLYYRTADRKRLEKIGKNVELDIAKWEKKEGFEKSYIPEKVLSGTGAGDTCIAAFLKAVLDRYPIEKSVQMAAATGASCVEAYDALSGLKSFEELEKKIEAGWKKMNEEC